MRQIARTWHTCDMQLIGPDHLVLVSPDPEALVTWYAAHLGAEVLRLDE